ncbi:hypothetical protein ACVSKZ_03135, partial [Pseudomonas aeruginosa]
LQAGEKIIIKGLVRGYLRTPWLRLARSSGNRTAPARSDPGNDPTSRPQGRGRSPAAMPGFLLCPRRGNV